MENKTPHSQALLRVVDDMLTEQDTDKNGELDVDQFIALLKSTVGSYNRDFLNDPNNIDTVHQLMAYFIEEGLENTSAEAIE